MIKITRHTKMSLRLSQSFSSCGSAKEVCILAIAWPLVLCACCHNSQLCLSLTVKLGASKDVTKAMVLTATCITQYIASKKTCKGWYVQVPAKKQERTEEEQPFLSPNVWDNLVLRTSNTPTTFVPCVSLVAWTSGIPQNWLQHRWHRCSWILCSFPVAPSRV